MAKGATDSFQFVTNRIGLPKFEEAKDQLVALMFVDYAQNFKSLSVHRLRRIVRRNLLVIFDQQSLLNDEGQI